jgi:hypothetical protein
LDMLVLAAQTRLIWKVALVYYQRPSLRDFVQLYANVASTAFIAAGVEDIDVDVLRQHTFHPQAYRSLHDCLVKPYWPIIALITTVTSVLP